MASKLSPASSALWISARMGWLDLSDLPVRIRLAEVVLEKRHHCAGHFLAERRQRLLLWHRPGAHRVRSRFPLRARGELADADRHQIAAEGRSLGELHGASATGL